MADEVRDFDPPVDQAEVKLPDKLPEPIKIDLDKILKCGLSRREISEMRRLGMKKPQSVPWGDWVGPKRLSNRQMLICYLAAKGMNNREIAKATGMKDMRISHLLQSEAMRDQIELIRDVEFRGMAINQQVDEMAPQAMRVMNRILTGENVPQGLQYRAADKLLDRKLGKPLQKMEVSGGLLSDMFKMMQEAGKDPSNPANKEPIEVEVQKISEREEEVPDEEPSHADWLEKKGF